MKAGDRVECPHCGENTIVKVKKVISGWQVSGEELVCALCSGTLGKPEKNAKNVSGASDKLAALLGGEEVEKITLTPGEAHHRGCRNCVNLLEHPFKLLCAITQREVDPMHECPDFAERDNKDKNK